MPIVHFINESIRLDVPAGETIQKAQIRAGLQPNAPCGGKGSCGKCKVDVRSAGEETYRSVLACMTPIDADIYVRTICTESDAQVLTESADAAAVAEFAPQIETACVHVKECARGESTADWDRLKQALGQVFGPRAWQPNLSLASVLGERIRAASGELTCVVCGDRVLDAYIGRHRHAMLAFDVGTTSIAGYLIDADDGATLAKAGTLNPQRQFGADVIGRANHALEGGMGELADSVRGALDEMAGRLCDMAKIPREEVYAACAVGNSCMHHLLLGVSPASLVRAPYNPAISESLTMDAAALGLRLHEGAPILLPPVIAGFVGADTVACMLAGHWERVSEITLLIDIGTNGEIILGNTKRRIACSTAAGPAFEGAKISCGMRGAAGAIDHVWVKDGAIRWHVIGDCEAVGICGSGLIDLIAALLQTGVMDESGRLSCGDAYRLGDTPVTITQKDIREVQLAKAAISAGIRLMARKLDIGTRDIRRVNIAGAFGCYMNPKSALAIGLLPEELRDVPILAVGNAAGDGACMALRSRPAFERASRLATDTEFLELATMQDFQDEFVDALEFPEEDA